jgi:hypothetical protein
LPGAKIQSFSNLYYIDLMLNCSAISHAGPCRAQIGFGRFSVAYELSERELRGKAVCVMAETYEQGMTRLVIEIFKQQEVMSRFSLEVDVEKQWKATAGICGNAPLDEVLAANSCRVIRRYTEIIFQARDGWVFGHAAPQRCADSRVFLECISQAH